MHKERQNTPDLLTLYIAIGALLVAALALAVSIKSCCVSTDALNFDKKRRYPVYSQDQRMEIIAALSCVDGVFWEESLEQKRHYLLHYQADILVMGNDWEGRFDAYGDICKVVYLPRTPSISTTELIEKIRS